MKNVEIVSLIFKSTKYLDYIVRQLKSEYCKVLGWDVGLRIVANDPTPRVIEHLKTIDIPYTIFNNPDPTEYYLNRVYRAYNFCISSSNYENICLVNSDDGFSKNWLSNLLKHHDGTNIPCSRLIESGKMPSGTYGVNLGNKHFGRSCDTFEQNLDEWNSWVESHTIAEVRPKGLYMPCLFSVKRAIESGLYPEGNVKLGQKAAFLFGSAERSGDEYYFHEILEKKFGMKHITVFDSLVYHIQEGEKDE